MAKEIEPHTDAWFTAMNEFNEVQAHHTRTMVDAAGSTFVCSICGDDESETYKLVDPVPHENAVSTFRLCDDCRRFRGKDFHETYERWKSAASRN